MNDIEKIINEDIESSHCEKCELLSKRNINAKCIFHHKSKNKNIDEILKVIKEKYGINYKSKN